MHTSTHIHHALTSVSFPGNKPSGSQASFATPQLTTNYLFPPPSSPPVWSGSLNRIPRGLRSPPRNTGFISGGQLNVTAMGNYVVDNAGGGRLTVWFHQSTVVRRRDMRGLKLKMMTVVTQRPGIPFEVYLATPNNTHLDSVHRYNFGLMSYIRDYFNFRWEGAPFFVGFG